MPKYLITLLLLIVVGKVSPQYLITVAGSGLDLYSGDNGPALVANLGFTPGVCVDVSGNLYLSSKYHVRKVDAVTHIITNFAGDGSFVSSGDGGPAISAGINRPWDLWCDKTGNIYITETESHRIRKVSTSGIITTVAGNGNAGYSGNGGSATSASLNNPRGVAVDDAGNIYIADFNNYRIRKVDASTGIISTVAGTGIKSYTGDGGPAVNAGIESPACIYVDKHGNIYFTEVPDNASSRVRKININTGIISTEAGLAPFGFSGDGVPALSSSFMGLIGIAVDNADNIYVAEGVLGRIRKIDATTKVVTTYAGTGSTSFNGDGLATTHMLNFPRQMAFDSKGNLYVADEMNFRVRMITNTPPCTPTISIQSSQNGTLCIGTTVNFTATVTDEGSSPIYQWIKNGTPVGSNSATYADNNLADGDKIYCKLTSNASCANGITVSSNTITIAGAGIINTIAGTGVASFSGDSGPASSAALNFPIDVCFDGKDNFYVADGGNHRIRKINITSGSITTVAGTGAAGFSGDGGQAINAQLNLPTGINLDAQGNLYIVDRDNNRVRKVNATTGIITTIAGTGSFGFSGDGGLAVNANLKHPLHLILDASGNIYFTDRENNRIRKIDAATGVITTVAGNGLGPYSGDGGPATSASLYEPTKICFDLQGNLIIADWRNQRIRKVNSSGIISTIAGTGVGGSSGDGGLATAASLYFPNGIVYDASGNLYIADVNHVVRKVDAATGIISKVAGTSTVPGFSGDSGLAVNAKMNGPQGMSFDASGNLYVCDELNHRIRKISVSLTPASKPNVSAPLSICKGSTVTLTISSGSLNNASQWNWYSGSCGGTLIGTGSSITTAPTAASSYYVRGEGNCVAPGECAIVSITVTDAALPSITIANSIPLHCFNVGSSFTATVTGTVSNAVYQWKRNGVNTGTNSTFLGGVLDANDVITCELTGTNNCGQSFTVTSNSVTIQSNPGYDLPPEVTTTASQQSICEGTNVMFLATNKSGSANPQYQWQINGVNAGSNSSTFSTTSLIDGASVTCIMTVPQCNNGGSTKDYSDPITMTVYPVLNPSITISASATTICKTDQVRFTAIAGQGGNLPFYQWKINGNPAAAGVDNFTSTALKDGDIITCELTVDPSAQCVKNNKAVSNRITIRIVDIAAPVLQINASQTEICSGSSIRFTAISSAPDIVSSYHWQVNGNAAGTGSSFSFSNLSDGDRINCTAMLSNGNCTNSVASNNIVVVVHPSPAVSFIPPGISINAGEQVQLRPVIQGDIVSHQWTPSNLLIDATSLTPLTVPLSSTTNYSLLVTTAYGCKDNESIIVAVYSKLYMPTSFTPNGDGHNDVFRIPPSVRLELKEFSIFDRWGMKIFSTRDIHKGWDGRINGAFPATGSYVYLVQGKDNNEHVFLKGTVTLIR